MDKSCFAAKLSFGSFAGQQASFSIARRSPQTQVLERSLAGKKGVEPLQPFGHRILSPACMPFHHLPVFAKLLLCFASPGFLSQAKFSKASFRTETGHSTTCPIST